MKRLSQITLAVIMLLALVGSGWAATYYINGSGGNYTWATGPAIGQISPAGNDSAPGDGSITHPWATLNKAVSAGSANDSVYVAANTSTEAWVDSKGLIWVADGTVTVIGTGDNVFSATGGTPYLNGFTLDGGDSVSLYGIRISTTTGVNTFVNNNIANLKTAGMAVYRTSAAPVQFSGGTISGSNALAAVFNPGSAAAFTVDSTTITAAAQRLVLDADAAGTRTFDNLIVNMALSGAGLGYNLFATGDIVINGGSYIFTGAPVSFIKLGNGTGTGKLTVNNPTVNMDAAATTAPIINVTAGAHAVDIKLNLSAKNASQVQTLVYIADQSTPRVHDSTFDTRGVIGDVGHPLSHVLITSTGATVGAARIDHNISYATSLYGSLYTIGNDVSGAGNDKCDDGEIDNNHIYGPLYYDRSIAACGLHALEFGWSNNGKIHHNYINGTAYGPIIKAGGIDYAGVGGIYNNIIEDVGGTETNSAQASIIVKGAQNVPVYNNNAILSTGYKSQYGILHIYTNNDAGTHLAASGIVKNNIFVANAAIPLIYLGTAGDAADTPTITSDNNCYYSYGGAFKCFIGPATTYNLFSDWQTAGYDANGMFKNPIFVSATDFYLQGTSPCINAGVDVGLTTDFAGTTVPQGPYPDIGAYEHSSQAAPGLQGVFERYSR